VWEERLPVKTGKKVVETLRFLLVHCYQLASQGSDDFSFPAAEYMYAQHMG